MATGGINATAVRVAMGMVVLTAMLVSMEARATDYGPLTITSGTTTLNGGDTVTSAAAGGVGIRINDATLNFGPGNVAVNATSTGIFATNGGGTNIVFQPGNNTVITTTSTGSAVYGLQATSSANASIVLQDNSSLTLLGNTGINLGATPAGTFHTLSVGSGATLTIDATLGASPKGILINTNNSMNVASGGTLDISVGPGNYSRALELSIHTSYASTSQDKFTAAAGSLVQLHTVGTNSQGLYILGGANAVLEGTTDIHTEGSNSAGLWVYRFIDPTTTLTISPQGTGTATVRTDGYASYGLFAVDGAQVTLDKVQMSTAGDAAFGIYATTDTGEPGTVVQANQSSVTTSGAGAIGIAVEGAGSNVVFNNGTVTTSGTFAPAVALVDNASFSATNSTIHATGADSAGLVLFGTTGSAQTANINGGTITSDRAAGIGIDGGTATVNLNGTTVSGSPNWLYVTPSGVQGNIAVSPIVVTDTASDPSLPNLTFTRAARLQGVAANATINATNSTLIGAAVTQPGVTSTVNLVNSVWTLTGNSNITNLSNDPSLIDFAAPVGGVYKTLTVTNYAGDGTIALNTFLGGDGSPSDKLIIDGGTATGSSKLLIKNAGGPGALTTGDGIMVVEALNGGTTATGAFGLASPVTAGAHEYLLYRGGVVAGDAQNWYLRSSQFVIDPETGGPIIDPETGQPEEVQLYRPEVAPAVIAPEIARQLAGRMLDTFHDRMGDQYAVLSSEQRKAGWARVIGENLTQQWAGTVDPKFKGNLWIGQVGNDVYEKQHEDGMSDRFGLFGSYGHASGDVRGFVEGENQSAGSLRMDAYGLGLYWTRLKNTAWYWDNVLMANYYSGRSRSDRGVGASMDGWGMTASTEVGYSFYPRSDIMVQPQAQLFYQYTDLGNTHDEYSSIRYSGSGAVTGRLGVLIQGNADDPSKIRPYARFNLWRRMGHGENVVFGDSDSVRTEFGSTSADVRVGLVAPVNKRTQVYVSAGYGFDLDGHQRQMYYGNVGVRYKW